MLLSYRRVAQTLKFISSETANKKCLICSQELSVISYFCFREKFMNYFFLAKELL